MNSHIPYSILLLSVLATPMPALAGNEETAFSSSSVTAAPEMQIPQKWTFDDCIAWATANNTDIRRSILNILQSEQDIYSAKDAWLPEVGFSTSQSFNNYPAPGANRNGNTYGSTYDINANWTVWEGNVRKYRLESSKLLRKQQSLAGDDVVKTLKLGILQAYLNILYAEETVTISMQTLEVSTSQTERAKRLMESGKMSKVDYAQIESQKAQDSYSLVQARNNYESAKMSLKKILELGLEHNLEIAEVEFPDADVLATLPGIRETYDFAASWLPEIKSNELNRQLYENEVKIAKAGNLPTVALQAGVGSGYSTGGEDWGKQMKNNFGEKVGLSLSIPIFDGNSTKRAVAKAKLSELEYDLNNKKLLDDLSQTIESLYIDANNSRAKYTSGITQLEATQLTSDLTNRQFELGLVNPLELLTAHNNLLNARLELLQSKYMAILANKTIGFYATGEVSMP